MCRGGIYDHLGGGFSRYSVDERSTTTRSCSSCSPWRIDDPAIRCFGSARRKRSAGSSARW
jgi:hypothetical protein